MAFLPATAQAFPEDVSLQSANSGFEPVFFRPDSDHKHPEHARGGGTRNEHQLCTQDSSESQMMALVPENNGGLTLSEKPSLFVYIPETQASKVVLSIIELGQSTPIHHSRTDVALAEGAQVIHLQPAKEAPPLSVGKYYLWSVVLVCGDRPTPNDPSIAAWIKRVEPTSKSLDNSAEMTPIQVATSYAEQGIWYESLYYLALAQKIQPTANQHSLIWSNFLESTGLSAFSAELVRF
ncbi:MAG: DUF928 domain-containing protein [Cyanobacteria bacterium P01_H01_bin.15]